METLKLEHLKEYLGCGLKIQTDNQIVLLTGIESETPSTQERIVYKTEKNEFYKTYFYQVKPILFPLDHLTKYREDLGFVPMVEMCKLISRYDTSNFDYIELDFEKDENPLKSNYWVNFGINGSCKLSLSYYPETMCFEQNMEELEPYFNQYQLFQKLQEWKFDYQNLIGQNLAIAVTEEFNPYR